MSNLSRVVLVLIGLVIAATILQWAAIAVPNFLEAQKRETTYGYVSQHHMSDIIKDQVGGVARPQGSIASLLIPTVVVGVSVVGLFLPLLLVTMLLRATGRDVSRKTLSTDEEKIVHDLWSLLDKMDDRLTNLETITVTRDRDVY